MPEEQRKDHKIEYAYALAQFAYAKAYEEQRERENILWARRKVTEQRPD